MTDASDKGPKVNDEERGEMLLGIIYGLEAKLAERDKLIEHFNKRIENQAFYLDERNAEIARLKSEMDQHARVDYWAEKYNEMKRERDEFVRRYQMIELANKQLTRNDHVNFGELILRNEKLVEALKKLRYAIMPSENEKQDWPLTKLIDRALQSGGDEK